MLTRWATLQRDGLHHCKKYYKTLMKEKGFVDGVCMYMAIVVFTDHKKVLDGKSSLRT